MSSYKDNLNSIKSMSPEYFARVKYAVQGMIEDNAELHQSNYYSETHNVTTEHLKSLREVLLKKNKKETYGNSVKLVSSLYNIPEDDVKRYTKKYFKYVTKNKILSDQVEPYGLYCINSKKAESEKKYASKSINIQVSNKTNKRKANVSSNKQKKTISTKYSKQGDDFLKLLLVGGLLFVIPYLGVPFYSNGIFIPSLINLIFIILNSYTNFFNSKFVVPVMNVLSCIMFFRYSFLLNFLSCVLLILFVNKLLKNRKWR